MRKIDLNEKVKIIKEYKDFAKRINRTPKQKDIKNERKYNNKDWIVTMHKINYFFGGLFELNEICGLKNHTKQKVHSNKKRTHKQFIEEVNKIAGDKYEFLTEYKGSEKEITIKCKKDGHVWTISANGFLSNGCKCPKCSNRVLNKNTEYFKQEVKDLWENEYTVLEEYKDAKTNILLRHNYCGNEFYMTPDSFLNKKSECPKCSHRKGADKLFLTHDEFLTTVKEKYGDSFDEYEILSPYKGGKEYVTVKHKKCGHTYKQRADDMKQGKRCKYCYGTIKKSQEKFEEEINSLFDGEYSVVGEYINAKTLIKIKHNKCGKIYDVIPTNILKGCRCSCETISHGEYIVKNFLEFNKIKYKFQFRIKECKNINPLPFDFAIFNDNNELLLLIEYDGIQHYSNIFKESSGVSLRDNIKNNYCKENKIKLLRIPYWEFNNVNNILLKNLSIILNRNLELPNKNVLSWEKSPNLKLIETFKKLPNGIYTKRSVLNLAKIEGNIFSKLIKNDLVILTLKELDIQFLDSMITISNNYVDYKKYFEIIEDYKNYKVFKLMKYIYTLYNQGLKGKYPKSMFGKEILFAKILQLRNNNVVNYFFYNQFLVSLSIKINNRYITFN